MDIVAHALYTNAIFKGVQKRKRTWREIAEIMFWGIFPDVSTFVVFGIYNFIAAGFRYVPGSEYLIPPGLEFLEFIFYSVPIFFGIFFLLWLFRKRPYWPLAGWGIHIGIDVFSHATFYPPHFLWPFSNYFFVGIAWDTPWFWFITYTILVIIYADWFFDSRKKRETSNSNLIKYK
jgi:hypothetical protein